MITEGNFILVQSEMNEWIDFAINILDYKKYMDAKYIVDISYTDWFRIDSDEPIAEYISTKLLDSGIENELYFKDEDGEEKHNV